MALPQKKKRGIRLLKHEGVSYYWKVREDTSNAKLAVIIGLEAKPSSFFVLYMGYVNPALYGPWLALAHEQGKDVNATCEFEGVSPKRIAEAIAFANVQNWQEKKKFSVVYKDGGFHIPN